MVARGGVPGATAHDNNTQQQQGAGSEAWTYFPLVWLTRDLFRAQSGTAPRPSRPSVPSTAVKSPGSLLLLLCRRRRHCRCRVLTSHPLPQVRTPTHLSAPNHRRAPATSSAALTTVTTGAKVVHAPSLLQRILSPQSASSHHVFTAPGAISHHLPPSPTLAGRNPNEPAPLVPAPNLADGGRGAGGRGGARGRGRGRANGSPSRPLAKGDCPACRGRHRAHTCGKAISSVRKAAELNARLNANNQLKAQARTSAHLSADISAARSHLGASPRRRRHSS